MDMERLIAEMPRMAKAVNEFASPGVQELAFRALMLAFTGELAAADEEEDDSAGATNGDQTGERAARRGRRRRRPANAGSETETSGRKPRVTGPTIDKTLNLRPSGAQSFADFAEAKKPPTNNDRNLVAVCWLKTVAGVEKVGVNQVFTCYKDRNWRVPAHPRNALQVTASVRGWLDTEDMDDIKVTPSGDNRVNHDLPEAKGT